MLRARSDTGTPAPAWMAVAAAFVALMFASGLTIYAWPVYFAELVKTGFSLNDASLALTWFCVVNALCGLSVARSVRRHDTRTVMLVGVVACSAALAMLPLVRERWHLYALFVLLGIGSTSSTFIPATTFLVRRLSGRKAGGLMVGLSGVSMGGVFISPIVAAFVESYGLNGSAPFLGLAYLVLVGLPGLTMGSREPVYAEARPVEALVSVTEADAGAAHVPQETAESDEPFAPPKVRGLPFLILAGGAAIMLCNFLGPQVHLINLAKERGSEQAVLLVSVVAGSSLLCRLIGAWLLNRMATMYVFAVIGLVQVAALVIFSSASETWALVLGAACSGFCIGNLTTVMSLTVLEYYGVRNYPRMFGAHQLVANLGTAAGPYLIAVLHGVSEGYRVPMLMLAVVSAVMATTIFVFVRIYGAPAGEGAKARESR